jgi:predicted membrane metal-binding protein
VGALLCHRSATSALLLLALLYISPLTVTVTGDDTSSVEIATGDSRADKITGQRDELSENNEDENY